VRAAELRYPLSLFGDPRVTGNGGDRAANRAAIRSCGPALARSSSSDDRADRDRDIVEVAARARGRLRQFTTP
jgi:hypothetical protein